MARRNAPEPAAAPAADMLDTGCLLHLFGYRLTLAELAARRVFQRQVGMPMALRPVEFSILLLLLTHGSATPKQLARTLRLPPSNITVLIDRLVLRALVERARSAIDGRATELRLSSEGRALARRAQRRALTMEDSLLAPLSAAERAMLAELLAKLTPQPPADD